VGVIIPEEGMILAPAGAYFMWIIPDTKISVEVSSPSSGRICLKGPFKSVTVKTVYFPWGAATEASVVIMPPTEGNPLQRCFNADTVTFFVAGR
jgi:hypothetical protein